jgi:hypothetical protein
MATRDIMMWPSHDTKFKFLDVPNDYDEQAVKHADLVGMFWVFNNGETWLTLKRKRLFRVPSDDKFRTSPGPEAPEDFPIMTSDELRLVLASGEFPPYEEVHAKWMELATREGTRNPADGTAG